MSRLELIVMREPKTPLSLDEVRELLSDHVEGTLEPGARAEVDAALARDPALREEHAALRATLSALRRTERPEPPADMLAKVRARLADERRQERAEAALEPAGADVVSLEPRPRRARFLVEAAVGLAAVLAVVIGVTLGGEAREASSGAAQAAGIGGSSPVATAELVAPGLEDARVAALAKQVGMRALPAAGGEALFEGDRQAAARFAVALRVELARQGAELQGFLPDVEPVRVSVKTGR